MKNNLKKGFTLIELLVVIAIIGLLAAVVLASLNSSRDKAKDGNTKLSLTQVGVQAALYYDLHRAYKTTGTATPSGVLCATGDAVADKSIPGVDGTVFDFTDQVTGQTMQRLLEAVNANKPALSTISPTCYSDDNGWAITSELRTSSNIWCVDSTGFANYAKGVKDGGSNNPICDPL